MSMYDSDNGSLYIPQSLRDQLSTEKYKEAQAGALKYQQELYNERQQPDWCLKVRGPYIIYEPYIDSPYLSPSTASGLILKRDIKFNKQSGQTEDIEDTRWIKVGKVIDVGDEVKSIKPGMDIMFISGGERSLPISTDDQGGENLFVVIEGNVLLYGFKLTNDDGND